MSHASDACREYAHNVGQDNLNRPWILTPFDTWERNPFYRGPAAPHPEDDGVYPVEGWFTRYREAAQYARAEAQAEQRPFKVFPDRGGFAAIPV